MKKTNTEHDAERARLRELLEAYGADRAKWPESDRDRFAPSAVDAGGPPQGLREARELDALLSRASVPAPDDEAANRVAERILGSPGRMPADTVVVFETERSQPFGGNAHRGGVWPAAALLAASLLIGVLLGQSEVWNDLAIAPLSGDGETVDMLVNTVLGLQFTPDSMVEEVL